MNTETKKVFWTVYTIDGKVWESLAEDMNEKDLERAGEICRGISTLSYLAIPVVDGIGRTTSIYLNPKHIVAIQLTEARI